MAVLFATCYARASCETGPISPVGQDRRRLHSKETLPICMGHIMETQRGAWNSELPGHQR